VDWIRGDEVQTVDWVYACLVVYCKSSLNYGNDTLSSVRVSGMMIIRGLAWWLSVTYIFGHVLAISSLFAKEDPKISGCLTLPVPQTRCALW
jgi:hypothetical protein